MAKWTGPLFLSKNIYFKEVFVLATNINELKKILEKIAPFLERIWVVILAGGEGLRLYGMNSKQEPKQFFYFPNGGEVRFIQQVIRNFKELGVLGSHIIVVVTNNNQRNIAKALCLPEGVISPNIVIFDPNLGYAGCMVEAAKIIHEQDPEALVLNTPSDQYLEPNAEFYNSIVEAFYAAKDGYAVIAGVKVNDRELVSSCGNVIYDEKSTKPYELIGERFIEKPDRDVAERLLRQGNTAVNTGINIWGANLITDIFRDKKYFGIDTDDLMLALGDKLRVSVGEYFWTDCGTYVAYYNVSKNKSAHDNVRIGEGEIELSQCRNSLFYADNGFNLIVTGADGDAVTVSNIEGRTVVLVIKLDKSQEVKDLANDFYNNNGKFTKSDFTFGTNNNNVLKSRISDEIMIAFVGVSDYAVCSYKKENGDIAIIVSKQYVR